MNVERENGTEERKEYEDERQFRKDLKLVKQDPTVLRITTSTGEVWERRGPQQKIKLIIPGGRR